MVLRSPGVRMFVEFLVWGSKKFGFSLLETWPVRWDTETAFKCLLSSLSSCQTFWLTNYGMRPHDAVRGSEILFLLKWYQYFQQFVHTPRIIYKYCYLNIGLYNCLTKFCIYIIYIYMCVCVSVCACTSYLQNYNLIIYIYWILFYNYIIFSLSGRWIQLYFIL